MANHHQYFVLEKMKDKGEKKKEKRKKEIIFDMTLKNYSFH